MFQIQVEDHKEEISNLKAAVVYLENQTEYHKRFDKERTEEMGRLKISVHQITKFGGIKLNSFRHRSDT